MEFRQKKFWICEEKIESMNFFKFQTNFESANVIWNSTDIVGKVKFFKFVIFFVNYIIFEFAIFFCKRQHFF